MEKRGECGTWDVGEEGLTTKGSKERERGRGLRTADYGLQTAEGKLKPQRTQGTQRRGRVCGFVSVCGEWGYNL